MEDKENIFFVNQDEELELFLDNLVPFNIEKIMNSKNTFFTKDFKFYLEEKKEQIEEGILKLKAKKGELILDDLENFFKKLRINKIYNNIGENKYEDFSNLSLEKKIIFLTLDKDKKNLKNIPNSYIGGGNCHHWSLLYNDLLNELGVENKIINFGNSTHSFIFGVLKEKKYFLIDIFNENKNEKNYRIIDKGDSHRGLFFENMKPLKMKDNFSFIKPIIKIYEKKSDFLKNLKKQEKNYLRIKYKKNELLFIKNLEGYIFYYNNKKTQLSFDKIYGIKEKDSIEEILKRLLGEIHFLVLDIEKGILNRIDKNLLLNFLKN